MDQYLARSPRHVSVTGEVLAWGEGECENPTSPQQGRFGLYIRKRIPPPVKLTFQVGVLPSTSHKINFSNIFEKLIADLERAAKKIRMLKKEKSSLKNRTKNLESENAALIEQNEKFQSQNSTHTNRNKLLENELKILS